MGRKIPMLVLLSCENMREEKKQCKNKKLNI